jgi:hypothetical protein
MHADIQKYVDNVLYVMQPKGLWILKLDAGWVPDPDYVFSRYIDPFFTKGSFNEYASGYKLPGKPYVFYFLHRKEDSKSIGPQLSTTGFLLPSAEGKTNDKHHIAGIEERHPIEIENEHPGTDDWILSNPAMNREIEGYMSHTSVNAGESLLLFYNTRSPQISVEIFRSGWYHGIGARRYAGPVLLPGKEQIIPQPDSLGTVSCQWIDPYVVSTNVSMCTPSRCGPHLVPPYRQYTHQLIIYFFYGTDLMYVEFMDIGCLPCPHDGNGDSGTELRYFCRTR